MGYQEGYFPTDADLQNAIRISQAAADGSLWANSARDEYGGLSQQTEFGQEIATAYRIISAYAMNGGDVSKIPQSLQWLTTTDAANRIAATSSGKWRDALPLLAVAGGGLAGVFGGAAAAGAGATGTEATGAYGAAGEFAGGTAAGSAGGAGTGATLADAAWGVNPQGASLGGGLTATASEGGLSAGLAAPTAEGAMGAGALGGGITSGAGGATGIGAGTAAGTASTAGGLGGLMQGAKTVAGAMPWGNLAGAVLEYMGSQKAGQTAENLMQQQMESDQWRGQQGRYFEPLYEAATRGIGDTDYGRSIAESTARKMASQGYDMSGNMPMEIAKSLHGGTTDYLRAVGPLAMGRGESQAPGQFAPALMGAAQAPYGIAGYGLDQIIKNWPSGSNQPSSSLGSGGSFQNYQPTDYQNIFL
jgi:hypothetical protein